MPEHAQTLGKLLRAGAAQLATTQTPLLDARILMKKTLVCDDADLIANERRLLTDEEVQTFKGLIDRRKNGEPVAYIIGEREFWGDVYQLVPGVLIPRPDSETLIQALLEKLPDRHKPLKVLDLGVGSGALVCALLRELPNAHGVGIDKNPAALNVAQKNAQRLGLSDRLVVAAGDWSDPNWMPEGGPFDIVMSNPPYIPQSDEDKLSDEIVRHEDKDALFSGGDGRGAYKIILRLLSDLCAEEALIGLEIGDGHAAWLANAMSDAGGKAITTYNDLSGVPRALIAEFTATDGNLASRSGGSIA